MQSANAPYKAEYYVETISAETGQMRGSFVGQSLSNKLPISWFNAMLQQRSLTSSNENVYEANAFQAGPATASSSSSASSLPSSTSTSSEHNYNFHNNDYEALAEDEATATNNNMPQQQEALLRDWLPYRKNAATSFSSFNSHHSRGKRAAPAARQCPQNKWHGSVQSDTVTSFVRSTALQESSESLSLWMLDELCEQNDLIEFR